jgi:hypothetical protein
VRSDILILLEKTKGKLSVLAKDPSIVLHLIFFVYCTVIVKAYFKRKRYTATRDNVYVNICSAQKLVFLFLHIAKRKSTDSKHH